MYTPIGATDLEQDSLDKGLWLVAEVLKDSLLDGRTGGQGNIL